MADLRGLLGDDLQTRRGTVGCGWTTGGSDSRCEPRTWRVRCRRDHRADRCRGDVSPLRRRGTVTSYADALRRGLGPTLYDRLYGPYAVKPWGRPGEDIDAEKAACGCGGQPREDRRPDARAPAGGTGKVFLYPRRGPGDVDAVADAAVDNGVKLELAPR